MFQLLWHRAAKIATTDRDAVAVEEFQDLDRHLAAVVELVDFLIEPVYLSATPSVRVNRQLKSLDDPNTNPMPPATLQLKLPTLAPVRPAACGVPGVAGVWA